MISSVYICCVMFYLNQYVTPAYCQLFEGCVSPPLECPNENITFFLYTRSTQDDPFELIVTDSDSIDNAPFVENVPHIILIHGYTGDRDYAPNAEIRPAYFERGEYNVISVDYNPIAREPCYIHAARNVPLVGRCTAQLMDELVQRRGLPLETFHVVGFSLGGQVAGAISNWIQSGILERITGLDPAMPLFVTPDRTRKLDSGDAKFVDVIHTNALEKGKLEASGHVDFYANGGLTQPGCANQPNMSKSSCDHWRAPVYFAESINSEIGFYGRRCFSWIAYMVGWCDLVGAAEELIAGEYTPNTSRGIYFFRTNSESPYAQGSSSEQDSENNGDQGNETQDYDESQNELDSSLHYEMVDNSLLQEQNL